MEKRTASIHRYDTTTWWDWYVKRQIGVFFSTDGCNKYKDGQIKEHFYYACIYNLLNEQNVIGERSEKIKYNFKAKLLQIDSRWLQALRTGPGMKLSPQEERISQYHIVQTTMGRAHQTITQILEEYGRNKTRQKEIKENVDFYKKSFEVLSVVQQSMALLANMMQRKISQEMQQTLGAPITEAKLRSAVKQGTLNKCPGEDGICHECYLAYWETIKSGLLQIFNSVLQKGSLGISKWTGIIVCIPKIVTPKTYDPTDL
jgi:hypothetical protein